MAGNTFTADISKFVAKAKGRIEDVVRLSALEVATRVTDRTPVASGLAKTNWRYGDNSPDTSTTESADFQSANAKLKRQIRSHKVPNSIYITNTLPYIRRLEHGHSKQAPHGMVRVTAAEWQSIVEKAIRMVQSQSK